MRKLGLYSVMAVSAALALSACGGGEEKSATGAPETITFSILSAEGQASAGPLWEPLLADMEEAIGIPVEPFFGSNYTVLVEAMRGNQTQVAWFSAKPAVEAIDRAFRAGATAFVTKPLNWRLLAYQLRFTLRAARAEARLRAGSGAPMLERAS